MPDLFMMQHGQSTYNLENRFTGWLDVPLSAQGIEEAKTDASKLKVVHIDIAFTSSLKRAIDTLQIVLDAKQRNHIPIIINEALNERNYGQLQGLNKAEIAKEYGESQVNLWRRSYEEKPPGGESLKDTEARVMPYFQDVICQELKHGMNVLIVAHGNSLRAIIKNLNSISDQDVSHLNIATGAIYRYRLDQELNILEKNVL